MRNRENRVITYAKAMMLIETGQLEKVCEKCDRPYGCVIGMANPLSTDLWTYCRKVSEFNKAEKEQETKYF